MDARDVKKLNLSELIAQLDEIKRMAISTGKLHLLSISFAELLYLWLNGFIGKYVDAERKDQLCSELVAGLPNKTLETNLKLWELAQLAKRSKRLSSRLVSRKFLSAPGLFARISALDGGKEFIAELDKFLGAYGHRSPMYSFLAPAWREDPRHVLELIALYLSTGEVDIAYPEVHRTMRALTREAAIRAVKRKLAAGISRYIPVKQFIFHELLKLTQTYMILRENQQFDIGRTFPVAKATLLEIGNRYCKRRLLRYPEDIFFLRHGEIRKAYENKLQRSQILKLVSKRRSEFERYKYLDLPNIIGGYGLPQEEASSAMIPGVIRGIGGSAGRAIGTARIILSPRDFYKFQKDDILVAPTTSPAWTPLFILAKAFVADVGGVLSHGAIISREYNIPAVLGTRNATTLLIDGQRILVDGDKGEVRVIC
jgi:pyruvate,water dikinase